ncbi:MAG: FAD-binding oxidoreductase [Steroidobacterales bacterium]
MPDVLRSPSTTDLAALKSIAGPGGSLESPADVEPYLVDFRKLYHGTSALVLLPSSTEQVSKILAYCHAHDIGLVPHGGNTSYCGGPVPDESGTQVVLGLRRLNKVCSVDPLNYSMTVEAGVVLAAVQKAAENADRLFPLSLGSEGSCQIGGNLSTNAGGTAVLRYGMARELVLGLEVVLADGRVLDTLRTLRKDNTGYDLKSLFLGSEGTLGIITAASLKLFPKPAVYATAMVAVPDVNAAVALLATLRAASGDRVSTFELIPRIGIELTARHIAGVTDPLGKAYSWYVLAELTSAQAGDDLNALLESALAGAMEKGQALDAVIATSLAQRDALWRIRETIPEAQTHHGASIKHDVSVPVARLPEFVAKASAWIAKNVPDARLVSYGHVGDGNLHFNLSQPAGVSAEAFMARRAEIQRAIFDLAMSMGGSFSAEHGIGRYKVGELERYRSPVELDVMRSMKRALDPKGILNPGKVLRAPT